MKDVKESCTVKASKNMQSLVKFFHLQKVPETAQKYSNICSNKNFPTKQSITTTMEDSFSQPLKWQDCYVSVHLWKVFSNSGQKTDILVWDWKEHETL